MATMFGANQKKPMPADPAPRVAAPVEENAPARPTPTNVIGKGTVIDGNIIAEGDLLVEGTVRGDVTTKTSLMIGANSVVEGNILAEHAEVAGRVKGTVQATGLLIIRSSSMIDGDVITKNLNVESGSTFNGRFQVGGKVESMAKGAESPVKKDAPPVAVKA